MKKHCISLLLFISILLCFSCTFFSKYKEENFYGVWTGDYGRTTMLLIMTDKNTFVLTLSAQGIGAQQSGSYDIVFRKRKALLNLDIEKMIVGGQIEYSSVPMQYEVLEITEDKMQLKQINTGTVIKLERP